MKRRLRFLIPLLIAFIALLPCMALADPDTDTEGEHVHTLQHLLESPATCTLDGMHEHYRCTECGERFWDAGGTVPVDGKEWSIPSPGHEWGEWEGTEATCLETGHRSRTCSVCGAVEEEDLPLEECASAPAAYAANVKSSGSPQRGTTG